ncbi:putative mitochondrial protein [Sesamum angolense]|uniref:Mitochondrial protein n=1 Tax=Sesamum angolense TaxID=2727404 RepID=A0AAE1T7U6_9LAMI|nr:putative mitochondrial protein [Sesamum angolense]
MGNAKPVSTPFPSVSATSQTSHRDAALHVLRYLKGPSSLGLFFPAHNALDLLAYSDASWASCLDSRWSITGFCFLGLLSSRGKLRNKPRCPVLPLKQNTTAWRRQCVNYYGSHICSVISVSQFLSLFLFCVTRRSEQLTDLFNKALPVSIFRTVVVQVGLEL